MMAGFARAFIIGRFVQRDVHMLAELPRFTINAELKAVGLEGGTAVGDGFAIDDDFTVFDQFAAPFARAEALRLQDAVKGLLAHYGANASIKRRCMLRRIRSAHCADRRLSGRRSPGCR